MNTLKYLQLMVIFIIQPVVAEDVTELDMVEVTSQPPTNAENRISNGYQQIESNPNLNRNFTDALATDVEVSNQSTGPQQNSPFIHGFTGYNNILLIDGVRMNNSIFRSGPNQYWSTIDTFGVDTINMYYGQSALLYGSDAAGAALNVKTRGRKEFLDGFNWNARTVYRFASAENSNIGRMEFEGNYGQHIGFLIGGSIKGYGNIQGGEDTGIQPNTGFDEQDFDTKIDWNLTNKTSLTFFHQRYNSDDAWRNHRTLSATHANDVVGARPGTYEYDIYDQDRTLSYIKLKTQEIPIFDEFNITGSYQENNQYNNFQNTSGKPKYKPSDIQTQSFQVQTFGLDIQAKNYTKYGNFTYGIDYYHDSVNSDGTKTNAKGVPNPLGGPPPVADNSHYDNYGMYINNDIPFFNDRVVLSLTSRYNLVSVHTGQLVDNSNKPIGIGGIDKSWDEFTSGGRLTVGLDPNNHLTWFAGINQGWRAPTLPDLTGNALSRTNTFQTPSPNIGPEKFVTYETGLGYVDNKTNATLTYYRTNLDDSIIKPDTSVKKMKDFEANNDGNGYVQGISFKGEYKILPELKAFVGASWTEGYTDVYNLTTAQITKDNMSKINPPQGLIGLHYDITPQIFVESSARFVGAQQKLNQTDYSEACLTAVPGKNLCDTTRIPSTGQAAYSLFGIRAGYSPFKDLTFIGAIDNLTNTDYRVIGSGVNGLGRNFIVSVDYKF